MKHGDPEDAASTTVRESVRRHLFDCLLHPSQIDEVMRVAEGDVLLRAMQGRWTDLAVHYSQFQLDAVCFACRTVAKRWLTANAPGSLALDLLSA